MGAEYYLKLGSYGLASEEISPFLGLFSGSFFTRSLAALFPIKIFLRGDSTMAFKSLILFIPFMGDRQVNSFITVTTLGFFGGSIRVNRHYF